MISKIEKRLLALGYTKEQIKELSDDQKTYLGTDLTFNNEIIKSNDWYVPGGVINTYEGPTLEEITLNDITFNISWRIDSSDISKVIIDIFVNNSMSEENEYELNINLPTLHIIGCNIINYPEDISNINLTFDENNIYIKGKNINNGASFKNNMISWHNGDTNRIYICCNIDYLNNGVITTKPNIIIEHAIDEENNIQYTQTGNTNLMYAIGNSTLSLYRKDENSYTYYVN